MKIGSLIKFHRTKQGLTQQTLADGICSVPHLSKIENNSKEANEETIRLLLERLSIDLQDVEKLEVEIRDLLKKFADHMYYLENDEATAVYKELKSKEDLIPFTQYLYLYEIYKAKYFLSAQRMEDAESQLKWLSSHRQNFSQLEKYLHSYIGTLILVLRGKMEEADKKMAQLIESSFITPEVLGEISYNYSLVKSSLNQYGPSIYYGKNALQQFKEDFNFIRIVNTQLLLAINYSRANMFNETEEIYLHLLRNVRILKMHSLLPRIYHNMGDLYHTMNEFKLACKYFTMAMDLLPEGSELYLLCLYNKAISESQYDDRVGSESSFQKLHDIASKSKIVHYQMFSKFYSLYIQDRDDEAMAYLETKILPYTEKHSEMKESHRHFSNLLAEHYKNKGQFDKALELLN